MDRDFIVGIAISISIFAVILFFITVFSGDSDSN